MSNITERHTRRCPEFNEDLIFEIYVDHQAGEEDKFNGYRRCENEEFCKQAKLNGELCTVIQKLVEEKFGLRIL